MPIYPVKCLNPKCGERAEVYSSVAECHMLRCPKCDALAEQDYEAKCATVGVGAGARTLTGKQSISRKWAFHPGEVGEAQQLAAKFGSNDLANCIDPEHGEVKFKDRTQAKKFDTAMEKVRTHYAEKGE